MPRAEERIKELETEVRATRLGLKLAVSVIQQIDWQNVPEQDVDGFIDRAWELATTTEEQRAEKYRRENEF
jgi:hypothetical protein